MSGLGVIQEEPETVCAYCGTIAECRPYGKNYERICFDCGMKDEETTRKRMGEYIFGETDD
jgi:ribosomal protein L32